MLFEIKGDFASPPNHHLSSHPLVLPWPPRAGKEGGEGGEWGEWQRGWAVAIHYEDPIKMGFCSLPFPHSFSCLSCHLLPQPPVGMFPAPQSNFYVSSACFLLPTHVPHAAPTVQHFIPLLGYIKTHPYEMTPMTSHAIPLKHSCVKVCIDEKPPQPSMRAHVYAHACAHQSHQGIPNTFELGSGVCEINTHLDVACVFKVPSLLP